MIILDTHEAFEDMVASGLPKEQAESIVRVLKKSNNDLATKSDIELVKKDIGTVRTEMNHEIELVRKDIEALRTELKQEIAHIKFDLLKWMVPFFVGTILAILSLKY